jgi:hypothetical protein
MTFLAEGDLDGARAVLKAAAKEVEPTALVAYLPNYYDLVWVLDDEQRELLLRLTPSAFDDDRGAWAVCLVPEPTPSRATRQTYAPTRRQGKAYEEQSRATPNDAQRHVVLGLALSYLGRKDDAIREGAASPSIRLRRMRCAAPTASTSSCGSYMLVGERRRRSISSSRS